MGRGKMKGIKFLLLGLCAFLGLCFELVFVFGLEPIIYGIKSNEWSDLQYVIHWVITCIVWGAFALLIVRVSKNKYGFDVFESREKMKLWQWLIVVVCIIVSVLFNFLNWRGIKIIEEFQNLGLTKFTFQYIYYFFEILLVTLIIIFAQKAFEVWFKKENFLYGGIILALSWGLVHIFTKGLFIGLISLLVGFIFGTMYLLVNRDVKMTLLILFIMFIL